MALRIRPRRDVGMGDNAACDPSLTDPTVAFIRLAMNGDLLAGPPSPEREEMQAWADKDYDPADFDL